ncbi:translocation/assembly module TamB domain-containing protein [uncultured Desulfuromusa sp.]|uniref:translocation/assembly module TamB domain-containing protein n=1 Tax=uncultured Desulfuromusa sp. TaxID=219183 RepID=UPI002AA7F132|nr:translocation/assembly module TamB domain-containing protein [uncultured Desulfuromusa sp.]
MKIRLILITLLLLTLMILVGCGWWLLYSASGSKWAVNKIISSQQGQVSEIQGTIAGNLQLKDMQFGSAGQEIRCADMQLTTRLQQFFPLHLQIETLQLNRLQVEQQTTVKPKQPLRLTIPELPWWLSLIKIDLEHFELIDFQLRSAGKDPFSIDELRGKILWYEHNLRISDMLIQLPDSSIEGQVQSNFALPSLMAELEIHHSPSGESRHSIELRTDLQASKNELMTGPINLTIRDSHSPLLEVSGTLGIGPESLNFQTLRLQRFGDSGSLTASGSLDFSLLPVGFNSHLQFREFDLQPETGKKIKLSGELTLSGHLQDYSGVFTLTSHAEKPYDIHLSGNYSGNLNQLHLNELRGNWLNGSLGGQALISWSKGWQIDAQLNGRNLDPQLFHKQLSGELNLDLQAQLTGSDENLDGRLSFRLNDSFLHNQPLNGMAEILITNQLFELSQLHLQGDGIRLQGNGKWNDRIHLSWAIDRLEQLVDEARGKVSGKGWFKLLPEGLSAAFRAHTEELRYQNWQLKNGQIYGQTFVDSQDWKLQFEGQQLSGDQPQLELESIHLQLEGALEQHEILLKLGQLDTTLQADLKGGWNDSAWRGELISLSGKDRRTGHWQTRHIVPLILSTERLQIDNLELISDDHGELSLQGYFLPPSQTAEAKLQWQHLNLGLLQPWLKGWDIAAESRGSVTLTWGEQQLLNGTLSLFGHLKKDHLSFDFKQGQWSVKWNEQGLQSELNLQLEDGTQLQGQLSSQNKMTMGWPRQGKLQLTGSSFPLARAQPWLPPDLNLTGTLDWQTSGQWQAESPWTITGRAKVTNGRFFRQEEDNPISAQLNDASISWNWREQLTGKVQLQLQKHGKIEAQLALPVTANWPVQWDRSLPINGKLHANLQELGLLSVLFPDRVQESRGQVDIDLLLSGNGEQPVLRGKTRLSDAGFFLPTLGIQLKNIELSSTIGVDQIRIESLQLTSAEGSLNGQGELTLSDWRPQNYQLQLKGENFQLVNLPDMMIRVTPDLNVTGDKSGYRLRGSVAIPELHINDRKRNNLPKNSPDLVVVDAPAPAEKRHELTHDIDLQLLLGEQVLVDSAGMDARLGGSVQLKSTVQQELAAFGEIHVVKGKYSSYGVSLDITRGNLFFNGGALDQPALDILALRQSGEVKAGVKVTGTPKLPVVQLYSEPAMAETDILSYIVLGRPIGESGSQSSLLMTAAGALLSQGESAVLQEKLKNQLGLDVLDISAGDGDVSSSIITTGKYLSPDLYVSLGYSLFSKSNEIKIRYRLTPDWELESNIGDESGVDLFYKLESK